MTLVPRMTLKQLLMTLRVPPMKQMQQPMKPMIAKLMQMTLRWQRGPASGWELQVRYAWAAPARGRAISRRRAKRPPT